jgi:hypothetical protein
MVYVIRYFPILYLKAILQGCGGQVHLRHRANTVAALAALETSRTDPVLRTASTMLVGQTQGMSRDALLEVQQSWSHILGISVHPSTLSSS